MPATATPIEKNFARDLNKDRRVNPAVNQSPANLPQESAPARVKLSPRAAARQLRSTLRQARPLKRQAKESSPEVEKTIGALTGAITSEILFQSIVNLISSYGVTLIYINIHYFFAHPGKAIFPAGSFPPFGEEWEKRGFPPSARKRIGLAEKIILLLLDLAILGIISAGLYFTYVYFIAPLVGLIEAAGKIGISMDAEQAMKLYNYTR